MIYLLIATLLLTAYCAYKLFTLTGDEDYDDEMYFVPMYPRNK